MKEVGNKCVAISHVWSDGLGNAMHNSLPAYQLQRLWELINSVAPDFEKSSLLWIDTLCAPLFWELRKIAFIQFSGVHEKASRVLVLDSDLLTVSATESRLEEKLMRICGYGWIQRLWTPNRGVLEGPRIRIQFHGQVIALPDKLKKNTFDRLLLQSCK